MKRDLSRALNALPPPLILAALYGLLILFGAVLLALPFSHNVPISWSDALFTSTSAVTVTGLVVLDTGQDLTTIGQAMLAFLIQMGGLGLMTFAVLILGALGLPVGITGHQFLREDLNQSSMHHLRALVGTILKVVLVCEGVGALLLLAVFVPELGLARGAWAAIFHSISAFNNAGFSTFADGWCPTRPIRSSTRSFPRSSSSAESATSSCTTSSPTGRGGSSRCTASSCWSER